MKLNRLTEKLAGFEPNGGPFISVYLDAQANEKGRDGFNVWFKKEISETVKDLADDKDTSEKIEATLNRVSEFLEAETDVAANGIAVFGADGFFETIQLDTPFPNNRLIVSDRPHIFPLVRIIEQNPGYAVLWADTNKADIYVFGGENSMNLEKDTEAKVEEIEGEKTNRSQVGGWSQARYQRHIENFHLQHAKEAVVELEKVMNDADIEHLVLCGDEATIMPILRPQLSKVMDASVVAVLPIDQYASEQEIRKITSEAMRLDNLSRDIESVERVFNAAKSAARLGTLGMGTKPWQRYPTGRFRNWLFRPSSTR